MVYKIMASIVAIASFLGIFWTSYKYIDTSYAKAEEVRQLEQRLDHKIIEDRLNAVQERLWKIEDRYEDASSSIPESVKEEKRKLEVEKERLEDKLEGLQK